MVTEKDLKETLRKHEARETPEQERAESKEEQRVEREAGVEKKALQQDRGSEDIATAATSLMPLGTTLHTAMKDSKGGDRGKEWLARIGASILGSGLGAIPGAAMKSRGLALLGGTLGGAGGEVLANRFVHQGKYDEHGRLKKEYGGKHDETEKKAFWVGFEKRAALLSMEHTVDPKTLDALQKRIDSSISKANKNIRKIDSKKLILPSLVVGGGLALGQGLGQVVANKLRSKAHERHQHPYERMGS